MKILVIGTWNPKVSREYTAQADELGKILAKRGHTLVASPSNGFQGLVASSYKKNGGSEFIGYFPQLELMEKIGEEILVEPDVKVLTRQDYPIRNILQIQGSEAVIGITGGTGTLSELIVSMNDYHLPTAFYKGSSPIVDGFRELDPSFKKNLEYGNNINELVNYLEINVLD